MNAPAALAALAVAATAAPAPVSACPLGAHDGALVRGRDVQVAWRVEGGGRIVVGEPFVLQVLTCPATVELVAVDATMPLHRHGMNYRPSLTRQAPGRWRVDGLLWHMAGPWELTLSVREGGRRQDLRQPVDLR